MYLKKYVKSPLLTSSLGAQHEKEEPFPSIVPVCFVTFVRLIKFADDRLPLERPTGSLEGWGLCQPHVRCWGQTAGSPGSRGAVSWPQSIHVSAPGCRAPCLIQPGSSGTAREGPPPEVTGQEGDSQDTAPQKQGRHR